MLLQLPMIMSPSYKTRIPRRTASLAASSRSKVIKRCTPPQGIESKGSTYPFFQTVRRSQRRAPDVSVAVQVGGSEVEVSPPAAAAAAASASAAKTGEEKEEEDEEEEEEAAPAALASEPMTTVTFSISRGTEFGQHLSILGSHPVLGEWSVEDSVPMDWVEGDRWEVSVQVPQYELVEYKYIVRCGWDPDGHTIWQGGANCMLATNQSESLSVRDVWVYSDWPADHPVNTATSAAVAIYAKEHPKPKFEVQPLSSSVPDWALDAVFYQIFPLGFVGAPSLNKGASEPVIPRLELVIERLDFLKELGVTAVYFSPLFESDTHGYDTADYFQIDRRMGDIPLFKKLVDECHARDIKVVLDGVFNHTGRRHFAFQDLQEKGPVASEYSNWYLVGARTDDYEGWCTISEGEFGFSYDCWEGHDMLPRLNISEPAVRQHIFDVAEFWLKDIGIDGWRLDVAHEISPDFWREFRTVCDKIVPDGSCLLVGEMIHGNYTNWVGEDRLHSGTNYQLSKAIWSSLNEHNYDELMCALLREKKLYGGLKLLNFIGNHDVARIASTLENPLHYTLATATLMLLPGIPCLYYGDELGMEGRPGEGDDPLCGGDDAMRRPMPSALPDKTWPEVGPERLEITKRLVMIKKTNDAFVNGTMSMNKVKYTDTTFMFMRESKEQKAVVLMNSADEECHPWPEMEIPSSVAPEGAVFTDIWDTSVPKATFPVTNGHLYIGPCLPNSVRVLVYDVPPPPKPVVKKAVLPKAAPSGTPAVPVGTKAAVPNKTPVKPVGVPPATPAAVTSSALPPKKKVDASSLLKKYGGASATVAPKSPPAAPTTSTTPTPPAAPATPAPPAAPATPVSPAATPASPAVPQTPKPAAPPAASTGKPKLAPPGRSSILDKYVNGEQ